MSARDTAIRWGKAILGQWRPILGIGAALAVLALILFPSYLFEYGPWYEGRRLSDWLRDLRYHAGVKHSRTCRLLAGFGPENADAAPALIRSARGNDRHRCFEVKYALIRIGQAAIPPLEAALADSDPAFRCWAAEVLARLHPRSHRAVRALIEAHAQMVNAGNQRLRGEVYQTLGEFGPTAAPAVPILIEGLADADKAHRSAAAWALGRIGAGADEAVPALLAAVHAKDESAGEAAEALGRIGAVPEQTVPALIDATAAQQLYAGGFGFPQYQGATRALCFLGAAPVVRVLQKDPARRQNAVIALGRMGPEAKAAVPVLKGLLKDGDATLRLTAALALVEIAPDGKDAVPVLRQAVRARTMCAPIRLQGPSVPAALCLIASPDDEESLRAVYEILGAWREVQFDSVAASKAHSDLLMRRGTAEAYAEVQFRASYAYDRIRAADRLGALGPRAKQIVPRLKSELHARHRWDQILAADLLWQVGGSSEGLKVLTECAQSKENMGDPNPRPRAREAIARMAPHVPEAADFFLGDIHGLSVALGDSLKPLARMILVDTVQLTREEETRRVYAEAVRRLAPRVLPVLLADLKHEDINRRSSALRLLPAVGTPEALAAHLAYLQNLGPPKRESVEILKGQLKGGAKAFTDVWGPPDRAAAVTTIGQWGPAAHEAVPALIDCLTRKDAGPSPRDPEAAREAHVALGRIGEAAAAAVPHLLEDMYFQIDGGDLTVAEALWRIARTREAFRLMVERLEEAGDPEVSRLLAALGAEAKGAIPALERVAEWDRSADHREAAAEALRRIRG